MTIAQPAPRTACCLECGEEFTSTVRSATFCADKCRKAWNNRRAVRGAELYDLFMAVRHERELAKKLNLWSALCRLASQYREEDQARRGGRKSWKDAAAVLDRLPWLKTATKVYRVAVGRGAGK